MYGDVEREEPRAATCCRLGDEPREPLARSSGAVSVGDERPEAPTLECLELGDELFESAGGGVRQDESRPPPPARIADGDESRPCAPSEPACVASSLATYLGRCAVGDVVAERVTGELPPDELAADLDSLGSLAYLVGGR